MQNVEKSRTSVQKLTVAMKRAEDAVAEICSERRTLVAAVRGDS